jgi:hypothetical protein
MRNSLNYQINCEHLLEKAFSSHYTHSENHVIIRFSLRSRSILHFQTYKESSLLIYNKLQKMEQSHNQHNKINLYKQIGIKAQVP